MIIPVMVRSTHSQVAFYGHTDDQVDGATQGDPNSCTSKVDRVDKKMVRSTCAQIAFHES